MSQSEPSDGRILTQAEIHDIFARIEASSSKEGTTRMDIVSYWSGELRWARNRVSLASDRRDLKIGVSRHIRGGMGGGQTNQRDDTSLKSVVNLAEHLANESASNRAQDAFLETEVQNLLKPVTWSDVTYNRSAHENGAIVRQMTERSEINGLLAAGYIEVQGASVATRIIDEYGRRTDRYGQQSSAQCSVTVRHPKGTGSGWAGLSGYDIAKIDESVLADRAFEKCMSSLDPVRIEPGRYTVVMEPQSVADMVEILIDEITLLRSQAEDGQGPLSNGYDEYINKYRSKLGLKIVDERVTISHDPVDPILGVLPVDDLKPVSWITNGVLTAMNQSRGYATAEVNTNTTHIFRHAFRMSGGSATIDEMIASTERGLLVTRFSTPVVIDPASLLATGFTRDGLWLIERGKVSKAVRNFRFTESPLFMLNNIDQLGTPVPVFSPSPSQKISPSEMQLGLRPIIVPPLKVKDFSFTSTIDAI